MKERPILFNGSMVRAILSGAKTQTRRVVKGMALDWLGNAKFTPHYVADPANDMCAFGKIGDRLWVRETFSPINSSVNGRLIEVDYRATYEHGYRMGDHIGIPKVWKPSIHMPRDACRLVLEITDVRVERLQEISEADAMAEGIQELNGRYTFNGGMHESRTAVESFRALWNSTGGDWDNNPWVWVISFRPVEAPSAPGAGA